MPLFGGMLGSMVSIGACLVATTVSIGLSLVTIAVSWILFRPELAIALVAVAAIPYLAYISSSKTHESRTSSLGEASLSYDYKIVNKFQ